MGSRWATAEPAAGALSVVVLCHVAEIKDGASLGAAPAPDGQDSLFLVRRGERVFAYRDACPHWHGARMAWRRNEYLDAAGDHIVCHGHGAKFDIVTGVCLSGPCVGEALARVAIEITAQGLVRTVNDHWNDHWEESET